MGIMVAAFAFTIVLSSSSASIAASQTRDPPLGMDWRASDERSARKLSAAPFPRQSATASASSIHQE